jgi:MFS transporter, ACS family, hexuronate transporter
LTPTAPRARWWLASLFVVSTAINFLDRQTLAIVAPLVRGEFQLSYEEYGWILAAFSIPYALAAPLAGLLIDRIGLNAGISLAVGVWSAAGILTGFTRGAGELIACRALLGAAEAGAIPAAGKAVHEYLLPAERGIGNALNQAAVSLGLIAATPIATWLALHYGWRMAFVVTGALGLLWIPVWNLAARRTPQPQNPEMTDRLGARDILQDRRMWGFVASNALSMIVYSIWTNFTTLYLTGPIGLSLADAARYSWLPPLFALLGGFAGGWLSLRYIREGLKPIEARRRACFAAALLSLAGVAIPLFSSAAFAAAGISLAFFAVAAYSVNMYSLPLDVFGARAAFAVSLLTSSYGAIQTVLSPAAGRIVDQYGFTPLVVAIAFMPLAGYAVLHGTARD